MEIFFQDINGSGIFLLRFTVGIIFLAHGIQKLQSWKQKPSDRMSYVIRILSVVEPVGALAMISGFFLQEAAAVFIIVMIGALYYKIFVWKKKFTEPGGWDLDLLLLAANLVIFLAIPYLNYR